MTRAKLCPLSVSQGLKIKIPSRTACSALGVSAAVALSVLWSVRVGMPASPALASVRSVFDGCDWQVAAADAAELGRPGSCGPLFTTGNESPRLALASGSPSGKELAEDHGSNSVSFGGPVPAGKGLSKLAESGTCGPLFLNGPLEDASDQPVTVEAKTNAGLSSGLAAEQVPRRTEQKAREVRDESDSTHPEPTPAKPIAKRAAKVLPPPPGQLEAWWPEPAQGRLNVLFVGGATFGAAISLLTDGRFNDAGSANQAIRVTSEDGTTVPGNWVTAINKQMLLFKAEPGDYLVSIDASFADSEGLAMGRSAAGKVYIR